MLGEEAGWKLGQNGQRQCLCPRKLENWLGWPSDLATC